MQTHSNVSTFKEPYEKDAGHGIPKDRFETDYVEFEDGDYRLDDLKKMGWQQEVFAPGNGNDLYLFYQPTNQPKETEGGGLKFVALEYIGGENEGDSENPELKVFAYGYGYSDGIRHIYYGGGHQKGYFYYPPIASMAKVLLRIDELAKEFCGELPVERDEGSASSH